MRFSVLGSAVGLLVLASPSLATATDYIWTGPPACGPPSPCGGDWIDLNNWSPNGVPANVDDTATINGMAPGLGSTVILGMSGTIQKLTVTGNTSMAGAITVAPTAKPGSFTWAGGILTGKITLAKGTASTLQGSVEIDSGELDNAGDFLWTSGVLSGDNAGILRNSGTLTVLPGASFGYVAGTDDADLFNTGTFTFVGPGTLSDANGFWGFHNAGKLVIMAGSVELSNAGNTTNTFDDGGVVSGPGTLRFTDPMLTSALVLSGTTTIASGSTVEIAHGAVVSGSGTIDGPGTLLWTGGHIEGGTVATPILWGSMLSVQMTGADTKDLSGGTITNQGKVVWDQGDFGGSGASLFTNSATFSAQGDLAMSYSPSGGQNTSDFANHGTFEKKSGNGVLSVQYWGFENYGTLDVQAGVVELRNAASSDHVLEAGSTIKGAVRAREDVGGSAHVTLSGAITLAQGATLEIADQATFEGDGTVGGKGTTVLDGGSWVVGDMQAMLFDASGSVTFSKGPSISAITISDSGSLTLAGATTWSSGDCELWSGTLTNKGAFLATSASHFTNNGSGTLFDNQGSFGFDPGSGKVELDVNFKSSGTVESKSGAGVFEGSYVQTAGALKLSGGDVAAYRPSTDPQNPAPTPLLIDIQGGRLEGSGNVDAIVTNEGTLAPGGAGKSGALTVTQTYTQSATGTFEVELGGTQAAAFDALDVKGDVTIDGTIGVALLVGFTPAVGDTFKVVTSEGADKIQGTFPTLAQPMGATVVATYDPKDVVLGITAVTPGAGGGGGSTSSSSSSSSSTSSSGSGGGSSAPPATAPSNGGCGCRVGEGADPSSALLGLGALALIAARRRRTKTRGA